MHGEDGARSSARGVRSLEVPSPARAWAIVVAVTTLLAAIHALAPAGEHRWQAVHIVAEKLYAVPLVLAAAWLGFLPALLVTLAITVLWSLHVLHDWPPDARLGLEQSGEAVSLAFIGILAAVLFERARRAKHEVEEAHDETLEGLVAALALREEETAAHSRRVARYALLIADELNIKSAAERAAFSRAAVLHDIGKIGLPDRILLKAGALSETEWAVMRAHPHLGAALVGDLPSLRMARELVLAHHERWDGAGYPRGLAGEAIPFPARVFAVADSFDALTSRRPYHEALSVADAIERIAQDRGTAFDPAVVDAFLRVPISRWEETPQGRRISRGRDEG